VAWTLLVDMAEDRGSATTGLVESFETLLARRVDPRDRTQPQSAFPPLHRGRGTAL